MKKVSELGLEVIQFEDQVLLVDKNQIKNFNWVIDSKCNGPWMIQINEETDLSKYKKVLTSTKPLEGLPLLVIKGEVDIPEFNLELEKLRFQQGYNKAKEVFRFTEDDLGKLIEICIDVQESGKLINHVDVVKKFNQSLTKKELYIEVEDKIAIDGHTIVGVEPKITSNQIKGVWK